MSLYKNTAGQGQYLAAYDTTASPVAGKTGDAGNITGYYSIDNGAATVFATANPTEVSSTHMKGVYWQPLAQAETNGSRVAFAWASSTSGIVIDPVFVDTDTLPGVRKNVALAGFEFPMIDSANRPSRKTGATVTATRSIDAGSFGACTNAAAEVGTTGVYKIDLSASDLNGATIGLLFTATGCDDTYVEILTQP